MSLSYPDDADLERVRTWDFRDVRALFSFIENDAGMKEFGSFKRTTMPDGNERIRMATGGWSGNEELMDALYENYVVRGMFWRVSAWGGLEIYIIPGPFSAKEEKP